MIGNAQNLNQKHFAMRLRITFSKTEAMRFTSHLDVYRTWERTLRRANLSLGYSQGFKPHPRINLACALPLGFTSENDIVDVWLDTDIAVDQINSSLNSALPPGLLIQFTQIIEENWPTLQKQLYASEYLVTVFDPIDNVNQKIPDLMSQDAILRQRQGKNYDLKPLISNLEYLNENDKNEQIIRMILCAQPAATGRPDEVILALGGNPEACRFHRYKLWFANP